MINSVSGYGSTGSICVDIAEELERQGHECYIAYGQITLGYEKGFKIGTKLENNLHNISSRLLGKQGYFTKNGTEKLVQFINEFNPDVIHLHNLHGNYLNLEVLFEYLRAVQKPVVWTLHDCWAFTGKCAHYTDVACYKWKTECHSCPQVHTYPPSLLLDRSQEMYVDKKKWFTSLKNLTIVPVSDWLSDQVKESFFKNYPIHRIYNWIDHSVFKETFDASFALKYKVDSSKFTIVLVSAGWHESDVKWTDALKLASAIDKDIQILMIGTVKSTHLLPENIFHIPYLNGKEELAKAYSISDVYVHLSTEDTFGKVIAEAMSCGTPAIVYDSTACPEIIDEQSGYVVEKRNVTEIVKAINNIRKNKKSFYSDYCRARVIENFDLKTNINLTIDVYKSIVNYDC